MTRPLTDDAPDDASPGVRARTEAQLSARVRYRLATQGFRALARLLDDLDDLHIRVTMRETCYYCGAWLNEETEPEGIIYVRGQSGGKAFTVACCTKDWEKRNPGRRPGRVSHTIQPSDLRERNG